MRKPCSDGNLNGCRIPDYFDTRLNAVGLIELNLHRFED